YLEEIQGAGVEVHGIGKIGDLFAGVGIPRSPPGATNADALHSVETLLGELEEGFLFANLIETDQVYGHRKDVDGFSRALREIDAELARRLRGLKDGDLLIVTADHGVDPAHPGTDHTREYAPLLAVSGSIQRRRAAGEALAGARHDGPLADVGATVLRWLTGRGADGGPRSTLVAAARARGDHRRARGAAHRGSRKAGQVPRLGLPGRRPPRPAPAHDRRGAVRTRSRACAHPRAPGARPGGHRRGLVGAFEQHRGSTTTARDRRPP